MEILETLERDVEILVKHEIMDYSLLFAAELNPDYVSLQSQLKIARNHSGSIQSDDTEIIQCKYLAFIKCVSGLEEVLKNKTYLLK